MYELKLGDDNEGQVKLDVNRSKIFRSILSCLYSLLQFLHVYLPLQLSFSLFLSAADDHGFEYRWYVFLMKLRPCAVIVS